MQPGATMDGNSNHWLSFGLGSAGTGLPLLLDRADSGMEDSMGWRYRRSYKILPGLRMNVGSRGVTSFSLGGRGVTVNMSKRGTKTTYSLPGTGISYQTQTKRHQAAKSPPLAAAPVVQGPRTQPQRSPFKTYAAVGAAAVIGYLVLRPVAPSQQPVMVTQRSLSAPAAETSAAQSLPALITPAMAAPATGHGALPPRAERPAARAAVTTTGANVRSMPSMSGAIVKVLVVGTPVQIVTTEGNWNRILDAGGEALGWVHGSTLR